MQGPLLKFTSGVRQRWVERYFEIRSHYLKYYESRTAAYKAGAKPKGLIDLLAVSSVQLGTAASTELLFEIKGSAEPPMRFKAVSADLAQQWLDACLRFVDPSAPAPQALAQETSAAPDEGKDAGPQADADGGADVDATACASENGAPPAPLDCSKV